jgi:hypothetical protein
MGLSKHIFANNFEFFTKRLLGMSDYGIGITWGIFHRTRTTTNSYRRVGVKPFALEGPGHCQLYICTAYIHIYSTYVYIYIHICIYITRSTTH